MYPGIAGIRYPYNTAYSTVRGKGQSKMLHVKKCSNATGKGAELSCELYYATLLLSWILS